MNTKTKVRANGAAKESTAVMNTERVEDAVVVPTVEQVAEDAASLVEAEKHTAELAAILAEEERPRVNLNDRLEGLEQLQRLAERHGRLREKQRELVTVKEANERGACTVTFYGDGEQVEVKNPDMIRESLQLMAAKLAAFIADTEAEICALTV